MNRRKRARAGAPPEGLTCAVLLFLALWTRGVKGAEPTVVASSSPTAVASSDEHQDDECPVHMLEFIDFKFFFVGCLGTCVAVIAIAHNLLLFHTFLSSSLLRRRNLTYLTCLSLCDIFVGISYIGIMSIQVYAEYFELLPLYVLWHECLNVAFTVSNITIATASFLLVGATFERYLQTIRRGSGRVLRFVSRHRSMGVFISFIGGIIFRGSILFEIEVFSKPECSGFASYGVTLSSLATNLYYDIWRSWIRRIMTVFIPFFVLAYCNAMIVYSLQENERDKMVKTLILYMTMGHGGEIARLRSRVRAATRILIMVVSCYLCANIIDIVIAILEYAAPEALAQYDGFYTVATDVSSLLSVLSSALRLPIYIANDKLIRQEIRCKISRLFYGLICCGSENRGKQRTFKTEKRRMMYEQLQQANATSPLMNGAHLHKVSCDSYSSRARHGIGSLIIARASVVSGMNESLAINYDLERCNQVYERAMAAHLAKRQQPETQSAFPQESSSCEQGRRACPLAEVCVVRVPGRKRSSLVLRKRSAPPELLKEQFLRRLHEQDRRATSVHDESDVNENEPEKTGQKATVKHDEKGPIQCWFSSV